MPKLPRTEGLNEARKQFNESLRKPPSDKLVEIVEETLTEAEKEERARSRKPEKAAKERDPSPEADV